MIFDLVGACPPLGVVLAVTGRGDAGDFAEGVGKMAMTGEAKVQRDVGNRPAAIQQQLLGPVNAPFTDVTMGRYAEAGFERLGEMVAAETGLARQRLQANVFTEMGINVVEHSSLPCGAETALHRSQFGVVAVAFEQMQDEQGGSQFEAKALEMA